MHGTTACILENNQKKTFMVEHPILFLKERMAQYSAPVLQDAPNFTGGLIGYFGYDTVRYMEKTLVNVPEDDIHMPDCDLFLYEELVAYDHLKHNGIVIQNLHTDGNLDAQYAAALWRAEELAQKIRTYNPTPKPTLNRNCHRTFQYEQGCLYGHRSAGKGTHRERRYFPDCSFPAV